MSSFYDLTRKFKPKGPGEKDNTLAPAKTLKDVTGTTFNGRCAYRRGARFFVFAMQADRNIPPQARQVTELSQVYIFWDTPPPF